MAIRSALQVNKGFVAKLYYNCAPNSRYWDLVKPDIELVHVDAPDEVFGNPVKLFAHKTDVLKLQLLLEHGGIYLDLDTICQRPFDPLLDGRVVLGYEEAIANGSRTTVGLCNATIISPPRSEFLHLWYEAYRNFVGGPSGDAWNKFSVQIPMQLARDNPHLLRMEPAASFSGRAGTTPALGPCSAKTTNSPRPSRFTCGSASHGTSKGSRCPHRKDD